MLCATGANIWHKRVVMRCSLDERKSALCESISISDFELYCVEEAIKIKTFKDKIFLSLHQWIAHSTFFEGNREQQGLRSWPFQITSESLSVGYAIELRDVSEFLLINPAPHTLFLAPIHWLPVYPGIGCFPRAAARGLSWYSVMHLVLPLHRSS